MSQTLTTDQILPLLNPDWWTVTYTNPPTNVEPQNIYSQINPSTVIYFQDETGNYHAWQSNGFLDPFATDQQQNYTNYLINECAYELSNMGCAGGITNIKPASYQPMPIYFK